MMGGSMRIRSVATLLLALGLASHAAACDLCAISTSVEEKPRDDPAPAFAAADPLLKPERLRNAGSDGEGPERHGAGGEAQELETATHFVPPPTAPPRHPRLGFSTGLILEYVDQDHPRIDTHEVEDPAGQYLRTAMAEAVLGARLGERFGLRAYLPYLYRSYQRSIPSGIEQGTISGLGDSELEATALALRHVDHRRAALVTLIAGVKMPTGSSSELDQEGTHVHGESTDGGHVHAITDPTAGFGYRVFVHPHDLALGTGSWDGLFGLQSFWRLDRAYATARGLYALRTVGRDGFHAGDELSWGGGPGWYLVHRERGTLGLLANVTGEVRARDELEGQPIDDSGATEVFIGPDLSATWIALSAELGVDLPVYQRVNGAQLVAGYRLHLGASWSF
jgi:hypothetical protein